MSADIRDRSGPFGMLRLPAQVLFGPGVINQLTPAALAYGRRILVCCDPFLATTTAWKQAEAALIEAGAVVELHTDIVAELPVESVENLGRFAARHRPDVVIGFGGGSSLDLAKLLALLHTHGGRLRDYYGEHTVPGPVTPVIAVPTTAGTGSEVTPVAVVSDPDRALKVGISSPYLIPAVALIDPDLTYGAPQAVATHSGIDAFVHAVESFTAACQTPQWSERLPTFVGRNSLSTLLAGEAIPLIAKNLRQVLQNPDDSIARTMMARGSLLAGMAFGTGGTHLSHAIQYPVGALSGTPHGLGTGLLLPYVLQACLPSIEPELARIAQLLGLSEATESESAQIAIDYIAEFVSDLGIPQSLGDIGIERDKLPQLVELASGVTRLAQNAPVVSTKVLITEIVTAAWNGDRSTLYNPSRNL